MKYRKSGTVMQTLEIELDPGDVIYSQTASMAWMTDTVRMSTGAGGGLFDGIKRTLTGGSFFITEFSATGPKAQVAFAPRFPGSIIAYPLKPGEQLICRKETFLCAEKSVTVDIAWQRRIGAGFFGGTGFILQSVTGPGTVFLDLSGEVVNKELGPGERLLVHAGHVGVHDATITFDIEMVKGFGNILFGGEGLFLASLTGPGKVHLQSMPILNLAEEIARHLPEHQKHHADDRVIDSAVGGLISNLLSRDD